VHIALRPRELVVDRNRGGLQPGIMNARNDQASFSIAECAAASIATAIVVVIALQGLLGSRQVNLSVGNLPSPLLTSASRGSSLKVSPWRLDNSPANIRTRPYRPAGEVTSREIASSGPGPAGSSQSTLPSGGNGMPASTFFTEAAPATAVKLVPFTAGDDLPLIDPPDLFRIAVQAARPIKEATIPPRAKRTGGHKDNP
jgi:hypothetical protein